MYFDKKQSINGHLCIERLDLQDAIDSDLKTSGPEIIKSAFRGYSNANLPVTQAAVVNLRLCATRNASTIPTLQGYWVVSQQLYTVY